jgi:hypothetical protein
MYPGLTGRVSLALVPPLIHTVHDYYAPQSLSHTLF